MINIQTSVFGQDAALVERAEESREASMDIVEGVTLLGNTSLCGHGVMAIGCPVCNPSVCETDK